MSSFKNMSKKVKFYDRSEPSELSSETPSPTPNSEALPTEER